MNIAICTDYGVLRKIEGKSEAANGEIRRPHLFLQWAVLRVDIIAVRYCLFCNND